MWDFSDPTMTFDNPAYTFDGGPLIPPPPPPVISGPGKSRSGGRVVLTPKKPGEQLIMNFDFASSLAAGEAIISAIASSVLYSGLDPNASLITGTLVITGTIVSQAVTGGIAGCIYSITILATTNLSQRIEIDGLLAIEQPNQ